MSYKALPARFSHDGLKMGIEARDLPVESAVVKEEYAQDLGEREDHLLMGRRSRRHSFMYSLKSSVRF